MRTHLTALEIAVASRSGEPIDEVFVALLGDGELTRAYVLPHAKQRLAISAWPRELLIYARGHRIARFPSPPDKLSVKLDPAIEVSLRVSDDVLAASRPFELEASIEPESAGVDRGEHLLYRIGGGMSVGRFAPWEQPPRATFISPGIARLTAREPGVHTVQCAVLRRTQGSTSSHAVSGTTTIRIADRAGTQSFALNLDVDAVRAAVEKARQD